MKNFWSTTIAIASFFVMMACVVAVFVFALRQNISFNVNSLFSADVFLADECRQNVTNFREALQLPNTVCGLNVSNQGLTGALSGEIRHFTNLVELNASRNRMTGIPAEIGQLGNLKHLDYSANQLDTMPNEIVHLNSLEYLSLAKNKYRELPESVTKMQNLVTLDLSNNAITSLPNSVSNLKNLRELRLSGNPMSSKTVSEVKKILPNAVITF